MENPPFVDEVPIEMEVSINGGTPKWMFYNEKSYEHNMDDLGVP